MANHVHWKKTTNPSYIGSWDLPEGKDMVVTIEDVVLETITNAQGSEEKAVMRFKGGVKPLILNKTNMASIAKALKTPYLDEWVGRNIQLYSDIVAAFGTTTEAIRVREFEPEV